MLSMGVLIIVTEEDDILCGSEFVEYTEQLNHIVLW